MVPTEGSASFNYYNGKRGENNTTPSGKKTRAGNDIDSFPFDKLSVGGAELAKSIISPLADPSFRLRRARDPLNLQEASRNRLDTTEETVRSSESVSSSYEDDDSPPKPKQNDRKKVVAVRGDNDHAGQRHQKDGNPEGDHANTINTTTNTKANEDLYYEVEPSPSARHSESFKFSSKHTRDPKKPSIMAMSELPTAIPSQSQSISSFSVHESDAFYEVPQSPEIHRVVSPPAKGSRSITFSTKFVKDPNYDSSQSTHAASGIHVVDLPNRMPGQKGASDRLETTEEHQATSLFESDDHFSSRRSFKEAIDPDAEHISRIVENVGSSENGNDDAYTNDTNSQQQTTNPKDSYYEVYDSPRATAGRSYREANDTYYSDAVSSAGWESGTTLSQAEFSQSSRYLTKERQQRQQQPQQQHQSTSQSTFSSQPFSTTGRSSRVGIDGKVHDSPNQNQKKELLLTDKHLLTDDFPLGFTELGDFSPVDPDGQIEFEDTYSAHGESLLPTPDDPDDMNSTGRFNYSDTRRSFGEETFSSTPGKDESGNSNQGVYEESEDDSEDESGSESESEVSEVDTESPSSSAASSAKPAVRESPFPSDRLLVCMTAMIALVAIGLVAGLTYYLWEKTGIDPIRPPSDPGGLSTGPIVPDDRSGDVPAPSAPLLPTDQELLDLFASVVGEAALSDVTTAGKAANWMLYEDPGKALKPRSDQGWIQRYLLVYTYYANTLNRSTTWLSCNPSTEDAFTDEYNDMELDDKDVCKFTYPTELPGGKVIYDLVPSYRWLSAADECQWGGVACGKTVIDEITTGKVQGTNLSIKTAMNRLAVTSIVLADQYLKGPIVTELTALPMLQVLDLSHNGLKGTLSEDFRSLETLRLQYNAIEGTIPSNFFDDQSVMKVLNLGSNSMSGKIPNEVGLASQMTDLYLFGNNFSGRIPTLGNMPLINFQGQDNEFTGMMPFDYGFGGSWPDTLREWWVYDNQLSGSLSDNLGFLTSLEDLRVNNNKLTGSIPQSIHDLQRMFRFDVHLNSLTGTVPDAIGDLPVLRDVRLQFNNFKGVVPTSLCFLESMEVLEADCLADLPNNNLMTEVEPQTDCFCCTTCCNPELEKCQFY